MISFYTILLFFNCIILTLERKYSPYIEKAFANEDNKQLIKRQLTDLEDINMRYSITTKEVNGRTIYECNRKIFTNYNDAQKFKIALREKILKGRNSRYRPKSEDPLDECKSNMYLGKDLVAKNIWTNVWKNCDYKCFSPGNYRVLKQLLLKELNLLRDYLNKGKLHKSILLNNLAQKQADEIAEKKQLPIIKSPLYKTITGGLLYLVANTIVNKWFNEFLLLSRSHSKTNPFSQFIAGRCREVGIGAQAKGHVIYIVLKIFPNSKVKSKY